MANTIYKFPLQIDDAQNVTMPQGAEPLCVQLQDGMPCLWATVDPKAAQVQRRIFIRGTGHPLTGSEGRYIGTFQMRGGALVFHAFDGGPALQS